MTPAMAALVRVVNRYCDVVVEAVEIDYIYDAATEDSPATMYVPEGDVAGLLHELAHWVIGRRDQDDYGLAGYSKETAQERKDAEVNASVLVCYWQVKAGREPTTPSLHSAPFLHPGDLYHACRSIEYLLQQAPPGLSDEVVAACRLDGYVDKLYEENAFHDNVMVLMTERESLRAAAPVFDEWRLTP